MPLARDVGGNFHAVREADAGDLTDSGVRLSRRLRGHLGADAALEGRRIKSRTILERIKTAGQSRHARLGRFALAASLRKLIDGRHLEKEDPRRVSNNIKE